MKKIIFALVASIGTVLFTFQVLNAQQQFRYAYFYVEAGDVTPHDPIVGASVIIKGTTNGAVTDLDGLCRIDNISPGSRYIVTYPGYVPVEHDVVLGAMHHVTMMPENLELE